VEGLPPRPPGRTGYQEAVTRDDLKSLRRWVIVAGVWAVAATAIALIALLDTSNSDAQKEADDAASKAAKTQRELDSRVDKLESQVEGLPTSQDTSKLEERLSKAESDASKAAEDAKRSGQKVSDLEDRVKTLEDTADSKASGGTDTAATPPP
jgi:predicted nuclease with TOPRIM domain